MRGEMERRLALRRVAEVEPVIDRMGAGGGGSAPSTPVQLVTHRSTLAGTPTLGGRTDNTRTEAQIQAGTNAGLIRNNSLETELVSWWADGTNKLLIATYQDVEWDEYGRVASVSGNVFSVTMNTGTVC